MKGPRVSLSLFVLATVLLLLPLLTLAGCGGSDVADTGASTSPSATTEWSFSPSPSPTSYPTPAVPGVIGFTRVHGDAIYGGDVYTVRTDGTGLTALADSVRDEGGGAWSPDGRTVVFSKAGLGSSVEAIGVRLWTMEADGSGSREFTHGKDFGVTPAWSPDGSKIAFFKWAGFSSDGTETYDIATLDADGSGLTTVCRGSEGGLLVWAANDRFYYNDTGKFDVYSVKTDGSDLRRVTRLGHVAGFALSPDGKQLAIFELYPRNCISVLSASGGDRPKAIVKPVPESISGKMVSLAWSPDGKAIAFSNDGYDAPPGSDLFIVNADGSGLSVVPGTGPVWGVTWIRK
jgi:Tol biopolymer transport system component